MKGKVLKDPAQQAQEIPGDRCLLQEVQVDQGQGHASTGDLGRRPATYFRFFEITQPTAPAAGGNFTSYEFHRKQTVVEVALFLGSVSHNSIQLGKHCYAEPQLWRFVT